MTTGFQVRDYTDYTAMMVAWLQTNPSLASGVLPYDLLEGSLERAHLEALAVVMEDYDVRAQQAIAYAVSNSVFNAFGFPYQSATTSLGSVTFSALIAPGSSIVIPIGTKLGTVGGVQFITTSQATLSAGQFTSSAASIQAVVAGVAGNVPVGAVSRILYPVLGIDGVSNSSSTAGGADAETDSARAIRFRGWVNTLVRGTKEALQFAAITVAQAGVVDALAIEPWLLPGPPDVQGNVYLYLDDTYGTGTFSVDGSGNVTTTAPSTVIGASSQVNLALNGHSGPNNTYIPGWKAAGIKVTLKASPRCPVFVSAQVSVASTGQGRFADIQTALTSAANTYFNGVTIGQPCTYRGLLVALSLADPDIQALTLQIGLDSGATLAQGLDLNWAVATVASFGCRFSLQNDGTFPKWVLS